MKRIAYLLILTATLGRITYSGHTETWYDLPMDKEENLDDLVKDVKGAKNERLCST